MKGHDRRGDGDKEHVSEGELEMAPRMKTMKEDTRERYMKGEKEERQDRKIEEERERKKQW